MADSPGAPDTSLSLTPWQRLTAHMQQQQDAQSGTGTSSMPGSPTPDQQTPSNMGPNNPNVDDNDRASSSNLSSPTNNANNAQSATLVYLGPSLKRAHKLGQQAATELDIFLAASPFEREGQEYAVMLACHDKLSSLIAQLDYKVPATLSDTCKDYAYAFMLSPTITAYRYVKTPTAVLDAMRELNIIDVPPKRETGRCTQVERVIRSHLTNCRFTIKEKVVATLKPGNRDLVDIASVAGSIVSSTKVKPTAALYMRIAFIRWVAQEWPEIQSKDEDFWLKVDDQLRHQVTEFKTPSKIQEACQAIYDADKLQFGPPDLINHPVTASYLQDDWLVTLGEKSSTLPQVAQGKKRARTNDDNS